MDDLNGAAKTMEQLFSIPSYVGFLEGRKQEVMIGYSDSAKDAGRLAASWAQYETQVALAEVAKKFSVEITYFHGKGGKFSFEVNLVTLVSHFSILLVAGIGIDQFCTV